jgi:hypothetical protein
MRIIPPYCRASIPSAVEAEAKSSANPPREEFSLNSRKIIVATSDNAVRPVSCPIKVDQIARREE